MKTAEIRGEVCAAGFQKTGILRRILRERSHAGKAEDSPSSTRERLVDRRGFSAAGFPSGEGTDRVSNETRWRLEDIS